MTRIIGGEHDGLNVWLPKGKLNIKLPNKVTDDFAMFPVAATRQEWTNYLLHELPIGNQIFQFLAPEDWTTAVALRFLFGAEVTTKTFVPTHGDYLDGQADWLSRADTAA